MKIFYIITSMFLLITTKICFAQILPPAAPTNFTGSETSPGTITFSWTDNSRNEDRFDIYSHNGDWVPLTKVVFAPANSTFITVYNKDLFQNGATSKRISIEACKTILNFVFQRSSDVETIIYPNRPDLTVSNVGVDYTNVNIGSIVNVSCDVNNIGTYKMNTSTLKYYIASTPNGINTELGSNSVSELEPNSSVGLSKTLTIPSSLISGKYYIVCKANATGGFPESVTSNNFASKQITVTNPNAKPDLTITNASTSSADGTIYINNENLPKFYSNSPYANSMSVQYSNIGDASFNSQAILRIYLSKDSKVSTDDNPIGNGNNYVETLTVGQVGNKSLDYYPISFVPSSFFTYSGIYYLLTVIDADLQVTEKSESNNVFITKIYIQTSTKNIEKNPLRSKYKNNDIPINDEINIYPNPSNGKFSANLDKDSYTEVKVYSLLGQLVYSEKVSNKSKIDFNLTHLSNGTYMIYIIGDDKPITKKITILK